MFVKKEKYKWGIILIIENGNNWKAIFHPENIEEIENLADGESAIITDEQKIKWKITKDRSIFNLEAQNRGYKGYFIL